MALYVKIILDDSEYNKALDNASGKASSFAEKLKSGLGTVAKYGTRALGAASTAIGAITKLSLDNYANYEQLVGGVETLFGAGGKSIEEYAESVGKTVDEVRDEYDKLMTSQQLVLNNASNAYKNAGMSANEYMETVTSFSASLLQSLDGDTIKAAKVANRAITDMSDNANKMGTSMEMIQNAYNGFAKQNYTMLDNLKLGYGGTKEEMERLIEDASKMTDIQRELGVEVEAGNMSFANIANAISVVQKNMGIMGTTEDEAAKTIQGSVASMKAAWSNLLIGLGDDTADMDTLINNFVENVGIAADNIIPRIGIILTGIGTTVEKLAPIIAKEIPGLVESLVPSLLSAGTTLLEGLISGILSALPTLLDSAIEVINKFSLFLIENLPLLVDAALQIIISIATGISENLPTLIPTIVSVVMQIIQILIDNLPLLLDAGLQLLLGLANGIIQSIPELLGMLPQVIDSLVGFLIDAIPQIIDAGIQLLTSIVSELPLIIQKIVEVLPEIIDGIVGALLDNTPMIIQAGIDLLVSLISALPQIIDTIVRALPQIILSIINALIGNIDKIALAGVQIFVALIQNLPKIIIEIVKAAPQIISALVKGLLEGLGRIAEVGLNLVKGLWNGINDAKDWLWDKISGWISGIWDGIKNFFGIHSPSTEMAWIGDMLVQGLANSINKNGKAAVNAAGELASNVMDAMDNLNAEASASFVGDYASAYGGGNNVNAGASDYSKSGINIQIVVNGANIQDDQELAEKISFELQMLMDRRAAVYGA